MTYTGPESIVLVSGYKGSGKDTFANRLTTEKWGYTRFAFADSLKNMAGESYGLTHEQMYFQDKKESPILSLPVIAKDTFTEILQEELFTHFSTADGTHPTEDGETGYLHRDVKTGVYSLVRSEFATSTWREKLWFAGRWLSGVPTKQRIDPLYWTPRAILILEGSTKRSVNAKFWVSRIAREIAQKQATRVVISDWRYRSELADLQEGLMEEFGYRPHLITVRITDPETTSDAVDSSERDLDKFEGIEFSVVNKKSDGLDAFHKVIDKMSSLF
jgi:hypothetical protein